MTADPGRYIRIAGAAIIARPRFPRALALAIAVSLFGCTAPRYEQVALRVSDTATGSPVAGAAAVLRPLKFFVPAGDFPSPTPGDFSGDQAVSDSAGLLILRAAGNAPSEMQISHPEYTTWRGLLEPWEGATGTLQWRIEPSVAASGTGSALTVEVTNELPPATGQ